MQSILPRALHLWTQVTAARPYEVGTTIIFTLQRSSLRHRTMKQLTQAHTAGKGWKCKTTWHIWGIRASNLRPAPKEDDAMESGADHRGAVIWEMSAQTCRSTRWLGVGLWEGRQGEGELKVNKTGDRETKEEILPSHFPPMEGGPSQNVFFPVSSLCPWIFFSR